MIFFVYVYIYMQTVYMYRVPMQMVSWRKTRWTVWILHNWDFFDTQVHEGWWGDLNVKNGRIPSWWRVHENYWMSSDRSVQRGATAWGVSGLKKETTRKRQMAKSDNFAQIDLEKIDLVKHDFCWSLGFKPPTPIDFMFCSRHCGIPHKSL